MLPVITTNFFSGTSLTKKLYWNLNYFFVQQFIAKKNRIRLKGGRGLVFWYYNDFFSNIILGKYNSENDYVFRNIFGLYIEQIKKNQSLIYTKTFNKYIVKAH